MLDGYLVFCLTHGQWARIQPLLPFSVGRRGRPLRDDRRVVEGIIYRYRFGIRGGHQGTGGTSPPAISESFLGLLPSPYKDVPTAATLIAQNDRLGWLLHGSVH